MFLASRFLRYCLFTSISHTWMSRFRLFIKVYSILKKIIHFCLLPVLTLIGLICNCHFTLFSWISSVEFFVIFSSLQINLIKILNFSERSVVLSSCLRTSKMPKILEKCFRNTKIITTIKSYSDTSRLIFCIFCWGSCDFN